MEAYVDDLSLSLDTLLLQHTQPNGFQFSDGKGVALPVLFSLRELDIAGDPVYTESMSRVERISEDYVLLGGKVEVQLPSVEAEMANRASQPSIRALSKSQMKEVTLDTRHTLQLTAEAAVERLVHQKLIDGLLLQQHTVDESSGELLEATKGLVIFSLSDLIREDAQGCVFCDMTGSVRIRAESETQFEVNGRVYSIAKEEEDVSEGPDYVDLGSSLVEEELGRLDLTMPEGGLGMSLEEEFEQLQNPSVQRAVREGQGRPRTLSSENLERYRSETD